MATIDSLPTELLQAIFGHCSSRRDQARISAVCHRWAEAVEPLQLGRTCLKVSRNTYAHLLTTRFKLIDKTVLEGTNRPYSCFRIEWGSRDPIETKETLKELLDVCQERFVVRRLYLAAPPQPRLACFFRDRHRWLQTLVELNVTLGWSKPKGCKLSLPSLKQLTWCEPRWLVPDRPFVLNAPELFELNVVLFEDRERKEPANCPLMSALELKYCPKLDNATLVGHLELDQRHLETCEPFLRNLKVLSLYGCDGGVASIICGKCTSLKELTIITNYNYNSHVMPLQISPVLSANLESLKLESCKLYGQATFQRLRRIYLSSVDFFQSASLVAPQLTTFVFSYGGNHNQLHMPHKEQIRTLKLDQEIAPPSSNVTELYLSMSNSFGSRFSKTYLKFFPNLVRLTLVETSVRRPMDLWFLPHMPKLESFSARRFNIRLTDLRKLSGLKSLILVDCILNSDQPNQTQEVVDLTALEYFRAVRVIVTSANEYIEESFPVRVNVRQPPIHVVDGLAPRENAFSSRNYVASIVDELQISQRNFLKDLYN